MKDKVSSNSIKGKTTLIVDPKILGEGKTSLVYNL